jgi:uncharacterized lipoprotein YddW (UPF0748 family)
MNCSNQIKRQRLILGVIFLLSLKTLLLAQSPRREMRGVWIASVLNIDYPSVQTTNENFLKDEWLRILDKHKETGINTLFVQIRPTGDALYKSDIVPWSRYLTGQSGLAPAGGFDPLEFMITSAHNYGFEFHAWLNPYRTAMDNQTPSMFAENHVMRTHPEWCVKYNRRYIMNPGLPEVRAHFSEVVAEIVSRYDVDGIHFDDYFYPHKEDGQLFPDGGTFQQYGEGFSNLGDWRRNNVDLMVLNISRLIKTIKPRVQFGISPPGVWRNDNKDPEGSATRAGLTCYDDMYADVRKWLKEGWIDYVVPQVYWVIGFQIADYRTIVNWWSNNSSGKPVYVGMGAYRVGNGSKREPAWSDPSEIGRQINLARNLPNIKGAVFFSSKNLIRNPLGMTDSLRFNYYQTPALPPLIFKDTSVIACEPPELRDVTATNGSAYIHWKPRKTTQTPLLFQYAIYRFENGQVDFTNARNIVTLIPYDAKKLEYTDLNVEEDKTYTYAIRVVDCNNEEVAPEEIYQIGENNKKPITEIVADAKINQKRVKVKRKKQCGFFRRLFGGC